MSKGYNRNVDINFSAHDAFLESPSSGTLKIEKLEHHIILKSFGAIRPKGLNRLANIC